MCGYYDVPAQVEVEKIFNDTRNGSLKGGHVTLLSERNLTLDGYPGRRFRAIGGRVLLDEEMFLIGERFYLITITTPAKEPDKNIDKGLNSFHFKPADQ